MLFGYPLDLIKTRMQRFPNQYRSIGFTVRRVAQKEGLRSFYVGVSSPMLGAAFSEALQFTMMTKVKTELANILGVQKLEN